MNKIVSRTSRVVLSRLMLLLAGAGCSNDCNNDDSSTVPILPPPTGQPSTPTKTLSPTCGDESTFVVVGFTGPAAGGLGDTITFTGGGEAKGTKTYDAKEDRWSLGVSAPAGVTTGPVTVTRAGGTVETLGIFTVPCPDGGEPPGQNAFEAFSGALKLAAGCDDSDSTVTLENFSTTKFTMTGLADNGPIELTVNGDTATAQNVNQFGKPGHTLTLKIVNGAIEMSATSPDGSCSTTLTR